MSLERISENENITQKDGKQTTLNETLGSRESLTNNETKNCKNLLIQIIASVISALFFSIAGISLAFPNIVLHQTDKDSSDFKTGMNQEFWIGLMVNLVTPVGGIIGAFLIDSMGRLNTIKLSVVPALIGWVIITASKSGTVLMIGQGITGLAIAWSSCGAIVYITELARPDFRGSLLTICPVFASLGGILTYCEGMVMTWKTLAGITIFYIIVAFVPVMFIPESPVWLISKGRNAQAQKALNWYNKYQLQPKNKNITFAQFQFEYLIKEQEKKGMRKKGCFVTFREFLKPTGYKPLLILLGLFLFQQLAGAPFVFYLFVDSMFLQKLDHNLALMLILCLMLLMSIVNIFLLKIFSRRTLIVFGSAAMAACMFLQGGLYSHLWRGESSWVLEVITLVFLIFSLMSLMTIPWTMIAELFPLEIRGAATCIVYTVANFLTIAFLNFPVYYFILEYSFGTGGVRLFYALMSLTACVYSYVFLPETHGVKLTDIQEYFKYGSVRWVRMKRDLENNKRNDEILMNDI